MKPQPKSNTIKKTTIVKNLITSTTTQ